MVESPSPAAPDIAPLLEFAALSGAFDPALALRALLPQKDPDAPLLASLLAAACDTNPDTGENWVLLTAQRRTILQRLADEGVLQKAMARRLETAPIDEAARDIVAALGGTGLFDRPSLGTALAAADRDQLVRIIAALDRAGDLAPAYGQLTAARAALSLSERKARRNKLAERGFFGRSTEIALVEARLRDAIVPSRPNGIPGETSAKRAVFLYGLPGIGKSALVEEIISREIERGYCVVVRLDFDRAGLDVNDDRALIMEIARQVADRIGPGSESLASERLKAASRPIGERASRQRRPEELGSAIAWLLREHGRPLLIAIDTFETLQARGRTHPQRLFETIDWLIAKGIDTCRILVAGRAAPNDGGIAQPIPLEGIDDKAARLLLEKLDVAEAAWEPILACACGNPLALRLAATIVNENGIEVLQKESLGKAVGAAMLYRILLSRISDTRLRDLADPGLIVRRISPDVLREVIAPHAGMPDMDEATANQLFDALALQHWLVQPDPHDPAFVRHRPDMRAQLLPLLYQESPQQCSRIDDAATRWFGKRSDRASQVDALYHRLQQMRKRSTRPAIAAATAQMFDEDMIRELPERARVLVRQTRGESSIDFGLGVDGTAHRDELDKEMLNLIVRGDWYEGLYLVEKIRETGEIDPYSLMADAARAIWWRTGHWADAAWLLRERDKLGGDDSDLLSIPPQLAAPRMEMRGEFGGKLAEQLASQPRLWDAVPRAGFGSALFARCGGWGMRLAARDNPELASFPLGERPDAVAAVFDHRQGDSDGRALRTAIDSAAQTLDFFSIKLKPDLPRWAVSQLLCGLSPYSSQIDLNADRGPLDDAQRSAPGLLYGPDSPLRIDGAFLADPANMGLGADVAIEAIHAAGLLAEWAGAVGFVRRNNDFVQLARAAERWRRTAAGDWAFGPKPKKWDKINPDEVMMRRIAHLEVQYDPVGAAFAALDVWLPQDGGGEAIWKDLRRRWAGSLRSASAFDTAEAIARKLGQFNLPSAFVPSVTVLLLRNRD